MAYLMPYFFELVKENLYQFDMKETLYILVLSK